MAKDKVDAASDVPPEFAPAEGPDSGGPVDPEVRATLWQEYLARYQARNPRKYAEKLARGDFKEIPASFKGVLELKKVNVKGVNNVRRVLH
jgi:hypothetical protein